MSITSIQPAASPQFSATLKQPTALHFGESEPSSAGETAPQVSEKPTSPSSRLAGCKSVKGMVSDRVKGTVNMVRSDALKALGVLRNGLAWNQSLANAEPGSSFSERIIAVADIAYARFREGSVSQVEQGAGLVDKLYQGFRNRVLSQLGVDSAKTELSAPLTAERIDASIIQRFPLLVLAEKFPGNQNLVEKMIARFPNGADQEELNETVKRFQARYAEITAPTETSGEDKEAASQSTQLEELKQDIRTAFALESVATDE